MLCMETLPETSTLQPVNATSVHNGSESSMLCSTEHCWQHDKSVQGHSDQRLQP